MKANGKLKKYLYLNNKYITDSDEYLRKGDYAQASERSWGAMVTIAKAIASQRSKTIKTHEGSKFFLAEIARELKDASINNTILIADALHQNFYEDSAHPDTVKEGAKTIKQFVK